jgi:hypothetical protein
MNDGLSSMRLGIPFGGWNGDEPKRAVRPGQLQREHRRRNSWAKIGQNYEWLRGHEPAHRRSGAAAVPRAATIRLVTGAFRWDGRAAMACRARP